MYLNRYSSECKRSQLKATSYPSDDTGRCHHLGGHCHHYFSISIDFEYRLRASYPFLIFLHPICLSWISWAGIFCAVPTRTLHPFFVFRIIDCYDFPNPDVSFPILSVDLKASYRVCLPIIEVHVQTGAACWCTICTRAPNISSPQIDLKCNCTSL